MQMIRDLRFAFRALRGTPVVSLLAIACIGLGIGSVTTVYSTATAFTFRPLPQMHQAGDLMLVAETPASDRLQGTTVAPGTVADLRALPEFTGLAALVNWTANIAGFDIAERAPGAKVSADFFQVAGRTAALGRTFSADDVREDARVVVLSDALWRRRFGADAGIIGKTVQVNGVGHVVIGVMPDDFVFPAGVKIWTPLALSPAAAADRTARTLFVLARRAPGVSADQANAAAMVLGARIAADYPNTHKGWTLRAMPAEEFFGEGPRPFMIVLLSAVAFLLLIACANVANLLLARATARRREMGLRVALGASRRRLVAQLLTESMLLALAGGTLGIGLASLGIKGTAATVPLEVQQYIPGFGAIVLDARAMAVAAIVAMLAGFTFGLVPALTGSSVDVNSALKDAGPSGSRRAGLRTLRSALVVGEIALALMLVAGAALMGTTFQRLSMADPGFRTARVLTATVTLPDADYASDAVIVNFWDRLRESLAAEPGVSAAEVTSILPMSWNDSRVRLYPEGEKPDRPEDAQPVGFRRVSAGYLGALGVPLVRGRAFTDADRLGAPLAIALSETAARRLLPGREAVGQRLVMRDRVVEVVAVVADVRANPLTSDSPTAVAYVPFPQWPARTASVVLRTGTDDPTVQTAALQRVVARLDSRLAAGEVATMARVIETVTSPQSATAQMLVASAFIALVMAAVGTYGVMAYAVSRRTREIGLRVALGATMGTVVRQVMGGGARLALIGVGLGLLGAVALGWSMQAILVETNPTDPAILAGAAALLAAVALVACWVPARRASQVDP
ncbi:MAG TPA: ABC transporter permease, partial [Vicinamibacterales bacterium]|nr:ABC transporter permease [Vicinamibacterales bacterium]